MTRLALLCPLLVLLASAPAAAAETPADCAPCTLRVMTFNIEWGGTHVQFASIPEAIVAARADIVGVQEPEGNLERLATGLGWHFSRRNHVISRYPLIDPPGGDGRFLFVEIAPQQIVAVANVHLPSDPYGPDRLRAGATPDQVMALEREVRLPEVAPVLDTLAPIAARGVPVFLTGDFNSPSHADWTEAAVGQVPYRETAFGWPVSRAIEAAGLRDSWRTVHPDPVAEPGFTWWAARPRIESYNPSDPRERDRIDFVWFAGPASPVSSEIVGEEGEPAAALSITPWPSDHRAVVSEFRVTPAPMPVLVTTEKRVQRVGENVRVRFEAGETGAVVLLQHAEQDGKITERRLAGGERRGEIELPTTGFAPGTYRLLLLGADGRTLSRNDFRLRDAAAGASLRIGPGEFAVGDPLPFSWENAPGNRLDWIAVFDAEAPPESQRYRAYAYVHAESGGTLELGARTAAGEWPLPPGRYVARLLLDDGYGLLAESAPFEIVAPVDRPGAAH
ncbi:MAG TPA: endonuclease/exonuclease/phosphatase family protein [Woeseiaceae bacterium]